MPTQTIGHPPIKGFKSPINDDEDDDDAREDPFAAGSTVLCSSRRA